MSIRSWVSLLILAVALPSSAEITVSTFAGVPTEKRQIDGSAAVAQFEWAHGIASDGAGNFYVTDIRTVRRIYADGSVGTAVGRPEIFSGPHTGYGADAFVEPHKYLAYGGGYVFFTHNSATMILRLNPATGLVTEYAGIGGGFQDGAAARFSNIRGMVVAPDGTLYVADMSNHIIRKITTDQNTSTYAGLPMNPGFADGSGTTVRFDIPTDVAIDSAGNVYVTDSLNYRIRKITPGGVVSTFAGNGNCPRTDGTGTGACFSGPVSLTIDSSDNLYVADQGSPTQIRKITPAGVVTTIGASPFVDGSIAFYNNEIYLATSYLENTSSISRVVKMDLSGTVTPVTGNPQPMPGLVNGPKASARFSSPTGIDSDSGGNFFITELGNDVVRKIDGTGTVSTFASGFNNPYDVAVDSSDNVYVADTDNHVIWRITPAGAASVFAGGLGSAGYLEGTGTAARFKSPKGIYVFGTTVYVADTGNFCIRRINALGETSLIAGLPGSQGTTDGTGFNVRFNATRDVVRDSSGNLFVSDGTAIRMIDTLNAVTTFAGNGSQFGGNDGTGTAARFSSTKGLDLDASGNLWLIDGWAVRKITPGAVVTTEAGVISLNGLINSTGTSARFVPEGMATTAAGVFVGDTGNHVIRQGVAAITDRATIDQSPAPVGAMRQLGTTTATATSWEWAIIRRPAASSATLSATNVREPTFTPDVPDRYRFRLVASNSSGTTVSELELKAVLPTPAVTGSTPHFFNLNRPTTIRINGSGFDPNITVTVGGVPYAVSFISSTEVHLTLPAGQPVSDSYNITLTNPDLQSVSFQHWFVRGPEGGYGHGDFNGDGREEIFWRNVATGQNALWMMNGADPSQIALGVYLPAVSTDWTVAAFGDFNDDGTDDVLWRNYHTGQNAIWFMSNLALSQGVYIESASSPVQWHVAGAGDVNGDGFADIIWRNYGPGELATGVWFMNGSNLIGTLALPAGPSTSPANQNQIITLRDFNGDARVDLLWRNTSAFTQEIWTLNGSGATVFTLPGSSARPRLAHDFDGDGDPDIVFESPYAIWTMNGTTMTSGAFLPGVSDANMRLAGAARIGNDPRGALLWRNIVSGENALWYINPGGTISGMYMPPVPDSNWDIIGPR